MDGPRRSHNQKYQDWQARKEKTELSLPEGTRRRESLECPEEHSVTRCVREHWRPDAARSQPKITQQIRASNGVSHEEEK